MPTPTAMDDFLFDLQGYLILKNAVRPELVDALNGEFDTLPYDLPYGNWYKGAQRRDYVVGHGIELHHCLELGEPFEQLIDNDGWINHVRHYCGEEHSYVEGLFIDECIASVRTSGGFHPVHSGGYKVPVRCQYKYEHGEFRCGQVNILIALTDIGPGDGATVVVPGSHKSNFAYPMMEDYSYNGSKQNELPPGAIEAQMKKGDALLFCDAIMHGGSARTSPGERRVIIFRYGPSWARTRFGYQYSQELLDRLPLPRRRILESVPPCLPGADFIPQEAPAVALQDAAVA